MDIEPMGSDPFARSRAKVEELLGFLSGEQAARASAAELEERLSADGRELICAMLQEHLDLRAVHEARIEQVIDQAGVPRNSVESGHTRPLATVFGEVSVGRLAYRRRSEANLYPADAELNLPEELHSHGLRELAAIESARGSFEEAKQAIGRATGTRVAKRQVEQLARAAAVDFDAFYAARRGSDRKDEDLREQEKEVLLCLSADGKGIVMRPDALRPATAAKAQQAQHKLSSRLSKGEKKNRKRMAELGSVFDVTAVPRTVDDILARSDDDDGALRPAPKAVNKWTTASVVEDTRTVIAKLFDEAERRDPAHARTWVVLVDGARHQIEVIEAQAERRGVEVHLVCDLIHVLEYLWGAAWCFFPEGDKAAEAWVAEKAKAVLAGNASRVAAAIRCKATALELSAAARKKADDAADYLLAKAPYLDYPTALEKGWPIATGVIEGACRHIVADRMNVTGARWGLPGAEAILKLRALRANADWQEYWRFHLAQERRRVHESCYAKGVIPRAA